MNKLIDKDLREALKRKEARRTNPKVPEDFLDNIMQEVAPKRAGRARYTYIAALVAAAACILSLMVFHFGDDEMPMPSEPTEKVVAEKATVTPVKEKKPETEVQVQPVKVAVRQAKRTDKVLAEQPSTVSVSDSLDYYINKIERELAQVDDSLYIERIHRVMHADERLQRIVNSYILHTLDKEGRPQTADNMYNVNTEQDDE